MRRRFAVLVATVACAPSCGGPGATPENCPGQVPQYEYVRAERYAAEELPANATPPEVPERIMPDQYGSLLVPSLTGSALRAVVSTPKFANFEVLEGSGAPKMCDGQNPCDGEEECDGGRCTLETRYYTALPPAQEVLLAQFGYKPSPNTRSSRDTSACGTTNPPEGDPCVVNVIVERCGDDGVDPDTCTEVSYPSCFTVPGAPDDAP